MDVAAVMAGLGTRLETIAGLRVFAYPPDKVVPPTAIIDWPDTIEYDTTYAGGSDRCVIPVYVLVNPGTPRTRRDDLARYVNRAGAVSVKAALQADVALAGAAKSLRVQVADFDTAFVIADVTYPSVRFDVEVYA